MRLNPLSWLRTPSGRGISLAPAQQTQPLVSQPFSDPTIRPQDAPGQSRGVVDWLKRTFFGWPGPKLAPHTPAGDNLGHEKVHSGPMGVVFPAFLPYFDDQTGESMAARLAYRKMVATPEVKSALFGKALGVGALELKLQPADRKDPLHKRTAEFCRWTLTERLQGGFPALAWAVLSGGLIDGLSVSERVWCQEERGKWSGLWPLRALKPKDILHDLVPLHDSYRNLIGFRGLRYNAGEEFTPADFLVYRHLPLYDSPVGMSDLRAAYQSYWMLDTAWKLRGMAVEKRSLPFIWATFQNASQQPGIDDILAKVRMQNWVSVPEGVKLEVLNIAGSADAIFQQITDSLTERIYLGIQGATLQALIGGQDEQRGNSKVHKSTSDVFKWALASAVEHLLNDREVGLIKDIVDVNFMVDEYPRASLSAVDVSEMLQELQLDTGLAGMGLPLSKEELYEKYGRTPPTSPDDELKPARQAGSIPGPGGGPPGTKPPGPGNQPPKPPHAPELPTKANEDAVGIFTVPAKNLLNKHGGGEPDRAIPFAEDGPKGGQFAKGGGHVPGKGGDDKPAEKPAGDTPPAKKAATVHAQPASRAVAKKLFGREPTEHEFTALACAPEGATVHVHHDGGKLHLTSERLGPDGKTVEFSSARTIWKPWFAPLTCKNTAFGLKGEAKGQGLALFDGQVKQLQDLGVKRIVTSAAGSPSGGGNGFYTWPRFGYGGSMSAQQIAALPAEIRQQLGKKTDILDLFEIPGGAEAWRKHGSALPKLSFDLTPGSRNLKALERYKAERSQREGK